MNKISDKNFRKLINLNSCLVLYVCVFVFPEERVKEKIKKIKNFFFENFLSSQHLEIENKKIIKF